MAASAPNQTQRDPSIGSGSCQPGAIEFAPFSGSATGQDFYGVLFGDCTGNWGDGGGGGGAAEEGWQAWLGRPKRARGAVLRFPIHLAGNGEFVALEARLRYDPSRARVRAVRTGPGLEGALLRFGDRVPGVLTIAAASGKPLRPGVRPAVVVELELLGRPHNRSVAALQRIAIDEQPVIVRSDKVPRLR
jgi:hypothetical protein